MSPSYGQKKKPRAFEWKVIRISYTSIKTWIVLVCLLLIGFLAYRYGELVLTSLGIPQAMRSMLVRMNILTGQGGKDIAIPKEVIEKRFASLIFIEGEVKVQRSNDLDWSGAKLKMQLGTGDRVRTYGGARAEVSFDDGSVLKIKPDSYIVIGDLTENMQTKVRNSSVRLLVSSIEADIKKQVVSGSRFRLEMPSATAELEKARVSVEVGQKNDSNIKVFSGQVAVDTGQKRVAMTELTQMMVGAGKELSTVGRLLPATRVKSPRNLARFVFNDPAKVSIVVEWQAVEKARSYRVQIDTDRRFSRPVRDERGLKAGPYRSGVLAPGVYFARIAAEGEGIEGTFSDPVAFMVILDRKPPEVTVQKVVSLKAPGGYDVFVEGVTEPLATVAIHGQSVTIDDRGHFSASLRGISTASREISLVARDAVGNETRLPLEMNKP